MSDTRRLLPLTTEEAQQGWRVETFIVDQQEDETVVQPSTIVRLFGDFAHIGFSLLDGGGSERFVVVLEFSTKNGSPTVYINKIEGDEYEDDGINITKLAEFPLK